MQPPIDPRPWGLVVLLAVFTLTGGCSEEMDLSELGTVREVQRRLLTLRDRQGSTRPGQVRQEMIRIIVRGPAVSRVQLLGDVVLGVGLSRDRWTTDGRPAALVIRNPSRAALLLDLLLSCHARPSRLPILATVDDGIELLRVRFEQARTRRILLRAVPPSGQALVVIDTDRTFTPGGHDPRRLGVRVEVGLHRLLDALAQEPESGLGDGRVELVTRTMDSGHWPHLVHLLGERVRAVGLSPDRWTPGRHAAAVWIRSPPDRSETWALSLLGGGGPAGQPPRAAEVVQVGLGRRPVTLKEQEEQEVPLDPVPAGGGRLVLIRADRAFSPGGRDQQQLGVRVSLFWPHALRQVLGRADPGLRGALMRLVLSQELPQSDIWPGGEVASLGLSPDRWTTDGRPAALVLTNAGTRERAWRLSLGCDASARDLPLQALVDDGGVLHTVRFLAPGRAQVELAPVMPYSRRLVLLATDRTFIPGGADRRRLGVRILLLR